MASIVLGLGTSHSPQLNIEPPLWLERGKLDQDREGLVFRSKTYAYDDLVVARAHEQLAEQITPEVLEERYAACQDGIAAVGKLLREAAPDVVIVVGDDQDEQLNDDNRPPVLVYCGATIPSRPRRFPPNAPLADSAAGWGYGEVAADFPGAPELAHHLVASFTREHVDAAYSVRLPDEEHGAGHAWGFVFRRIMDGFEVPMIPVMLNTYYPPNAPTSARSYDIGRALRRAVESFDEDLRVAVIASGGLTHFIVDEEFDRQVLDALAHNDEAAIKRLPEPNLQSGTSEVKNWVCTAGAAEHLTFELIDYVPCYRSEAGTGCAMGFAAWR